MKSTLRLESRSLKMLCTKFRLTMAGNTFEIGAAAVPERICLMYSLVDERIKSCVRAGEHMVLC